MALLNIIWDNSIELFAPGGRTKGDLKKSKFQNRLFKFYTKRTTIFSLNWQINSKKGWMAWYLNFSTRQFIFETSFGRIVSPNLRMNVQEEESLKDKKILR